MGKSYIDFGGFFKKKPKDDRTRTEDELLSAATKAWGTFRDPLLAAPPPLNTPFSQQNKTQNATQASMFAQQQAQAQATENLTMEALLKQQHEMQMMMQQAPTTPEIPGYAPIQDCHCKAGCWDCDDRKVMAIPTVEWEKNV